MIPRISLTQFCVRGGRRPLSEMSYVRFVVCQVYCSKKRLPFHVWRFVPFKKCAHVRGIIADLSISRQFVVSECSSPLDVVRSRSVVCLKLSWWSTPISAPNRCACLPVACNALCALSFLLIIACFALWCNSIWRFFESLSKFAHRKLRGFLPLLVSLLVMGSLDPAGTILTPTLPLPSILCLPTLITGN